MTTTMTLHPSVNEIRKWLDKVINDPESRRRVLLRAALEISDNRYLYPAPGPWNFEPGNPNNKRKGVWYQRNVGTRYRKKDDTFGGINNSERLQKSWSKEISSDIYSISVFTDVTYAPYLFDPAIRVNWAKSHGWKTLDEIDEEYSPRFMKIVEEEIDRNVAKPI